MIARREFVRRLSALAVVAATASAGCNPRDGRRTAEFSGPTMGSTWSVRIVADRQRLNGEASRELDRRIRDELARINSLMSTWDEDSELSRFNRSTDTGPFRVSPETFEVFQRSVELAELTGGALDVTLAPVVRAWGFGGGVETPAAPDETTLKQLLEATGTRHLDLDPDGQWVRKRRPDVQVDFSALAPGFAVDRLGALLQGQGLSDFLVDIGGELLARGRNERGQPWQVAIERPEADRRTAQRVIPLLDTAIATSGDYRNYREVGGERISHLLDPRTGHPIRHRLTSVTVIDSECVTADALATALMVLGPDEGMALARRLNLAVLMLVRNRDGHVEQRLSPRLEDRLRTP